jgi:hypothetical protein
MPITVKKTVLWRREIDNRPGTLGSALEPLAAIGSDLQLVMVYRLPETGKGAIEVHPITGRKARATAESAGLAPSPIPVLLVEGDNRPGLGFALAKSVGDAGINVAFLMAQVVGRRYTAVLGFENDAAATRAASAIKQAAKPVRKARAT